MRGVTDVAGGRSVPAWVGWSLLTLFCWGIWAVLSKAIPADAMSAADIQVVSTLGLLPVLLALVVLPDRRSSGRTRLGIALALGAGVVSSLANIPYYSLLSDHKAASVVPLTSMYPLVTVLLAVPLLNERLNTVQLLGVALSLAAIYLFNVRGEEGWLSSWLVTALVPVAMWGTAGLIQKMATNHISGARSAFWFLAAFVLVGAVMAAVDPPPRQIAPHVLGLAIALGFALALGNYTILLAFSHQGKASIITPLTGLYPIISIPIAMVHWHETITYREASGIACAFLAVVLLACETRTAADQSTVVLE
jgi:transporter family protein